MIDGSKNVGRVWLNERKKEGIGKECFHYRRHCNSLTGTVSSYIFDAANNADPNSRGDNIRPNKVNFEG